jgi:hypothetical protein
MNQKQMTRLILIYVVLVLATAMLMGCQTAQFSPTPSSGQLPVYRHDLKIKLNGVKFNGTGVAERAPKYEVEVNPKDPIDRIIWQTCHQEQVVDRPKTGWFNDTYTFTLNNVSPIEDQTSCPLSITILTEKTRRNALALIEFTDVRPEVSLAATVRCNGQSTLYSKGVSVCQASSGLIQEIEFSEPVIHTGSINNCATMDKGPQKVFRFAMPEGHCTYYFGANTKHANGKRLLHRLQTVGYSEVTPR